MSDLPCWRGAGRPERVVLDGRYARLEPFDLARHEASLLEASSVPDAEERFRYLFEEAPNPEAFHLWARRAAASTDPLFFAVIDKATGRAEGRQALMRIDAANGVIEIGSIYWGPAIARTRVTTEGVYLFACYIFDQLGYRRFEWKCNNLNDPSKRAAERFGFVYEGLFRQHMVVKGKNRDTIWFALIDRDWPSAKQAFQTWLSPANFDADGCQRTKLMFGNQQSRHR